MQDRRIQERRNLIYYLQVVEKGTNRLLGRLVDITADGMMMIADHQLAPLAIFQLRLQLPQEGFEQEFLDLEARSLWCRPDVNPNFFDTGFEFFNLTDRDRRIIQGLVAIYGFPHNSDRLEAELLEGH
jgi:c-di-GMP-binding flagellar brake protein YcgR